MVVAAGAAAAGLTRVNGPDVVRTTTVSGPVPFQAVQALDRFTVSGNYGYHLYFSLDGLVVVAHGNRTVSGLFDDNQITRTAAYAPLARTVLDFSLRVGENRTETLRVFVDGQPAGTIVSSITFAGFEDVTTPAGVFQGACHFVYPSSQEGVDTTVNAWFARGSGVEVRTLTTTLVAEPGNDGPRLTPVREDLRLVLATLNGMLVSR